MLSCNNLSKHYRISVFFAKSEFQTQAEYRALHNSYTHSQSRKKGANNSNSANSQYMNLPIPNCTVFAQVIEKTTGQTTNWSKCMDKENDMAAFKRCVGSVSPALVKSTHLMIPPCNEIQRAYVRGVTRGQAKKRPKIVPPSCEFVIAAAKSWRKPLPEHLKACDDYSAKNVPEHLTKCLSLENEIIRLRDCKSVRLAYERKIDLANGYRPYDYLPLPCDLTVALISKGEQIREQRRIAAEKIAKAIKERKRKVAQQHKERITKIKTSMANKYADTPQGIQSRLSPLEKTYRKNGLADTCVPLGYTSTYCPPTPEEIRLAMMRRHKDKTGFKMVNGHLLHGLTPTVLTVLYAMGGKQGGGELGLELHYKDAQLFYDCNLDKGYYKCIFELPINYKFDQLTQLYVDTLDKGFAFNFNDFFITLMDSSAATKEHYFKFKIDNRGLWQAEPTIEQRLTDLESEIHSLNHKIQ